MSGPEGSADEPEAPTLRIVTPDATPEEIAALVAVFAAAGTDEPPAKPVSQWSAHHRKLRPAYRSGPGGWRSSGMPG